MPLIARLVAFNVIGRLGLAHTDLKVSTRNG